MKQSKVSLDQWQVFQAVVDTGGFAQAAEKLHRSQSSVSYAMSKLQEILGVQVLRIAGRKAQLTAEGRTLLQWSRNLVRDSLEIEELGRHLSKGMATEINLVVELACPNGLLVRVLKDFAQHYPLTRVQLQEVVLSGVDAAIEKGLADLVITPVYHGTVGDALMKVEFVAVAHTHHPVMQIERPRLRDLEKFHQVVIRDSGLFTRDAGWIQSKYRWTVSSLGSALEFIRAGLGFAWLPEHSVQEFISSGHLQAIPLTENARFEVPLQILYPKVDHTDSPSRIMAQLFHQYAEEWVA